MANGLWVVSGSGTDIWDSADSCHFVRQPWSGDGSIVARVVSCQNTDPWAKAGVMVRSSLAPEAANYAAVVSPASGSQTQWRNTVSGTTSNYWASVTGVPYWVKVARRGDTFLGCVSSDGVNWTMLGGQTIPMTNALAGLVVSSHSDSLNTSIFDNVGFSSSIDPLPWMNADIGAVGEAGYINYNDGKFTIESFGFDCWAAQDQFHCLYRPIGTNATLTVRLTSMEPGDGWAKAGLMIRSDLSDAAAYSGTMFASEYGTLLQRRYLAETSTVQVMGPNLPLPCWLRVVRRGSLFYNYASSNGADWVQIGAAVTVYMGQTAYACVFVTTHNLEPAAMQKAQFESVSVAP